MSWKVFKMELRLKFGMYDVLGKAFLRTLSLFRPGFFLALPTLVNFERKAKIHFAKLSCIHTFSYSRFQVKTNFFLLSLSILKDFWNQEQKKDWIFHIIYHMIWFFPMSNSRLYYNCDSLCINCLHKNQSLEARFLCFIKVSINNLYAKIINVDNFFHYTWYTCFATKVLLIRNALQVSLYRVDIIFLSSCM